MIRCIWLCQVGLFAGGGAVSLNGCKKFQRFSLEFHVNLCHHLSAKRDLKNDYS